MAVGNHRRRRSRPAGRRMLLGFGVTGAGFAAIAIAVAVGVGQVGGRTACTTTHQASALPVSALPASELSLSALSLPAVAGAARSASGTVSGIATHYVLEGLPNCSYPSPPADGLFVALSPSEYDGAAACGGYLEVSGPDGSVRVEVIDQCPECATGHIDLSEPAFARLAPLNAGLIKVSYTYLADPAPPGPITLEVKQGSSPYWLALLAGNTGNPLASVQVRTGSGGWTSLARANYNYWIAQSGAGSGPFTVRLTDTSGNQVTVSNIALAPGTVQSTGTTMYGAGSSPAPVTSSPAPGPASATPSAVSSPAASSRAAATPTAASAAATSPHASPSPRASSSATPAHPSPARTGPPATDPQRTQAPPAPSASPSC